MNILDAKYNFEWRDYFKILLRRKWFFLVPFVLVLTAGVIFILTRKPVYESVSVVQIQPNRMPKQLNRILPEVTDHQRYLSLRNQILSTEFLLRLIHEIKLDQDPKIIEMAKAMHKQESDKSVQDFVEYLLLKELHENVSVRVFGESNVEIKALADTPEKAYLVVKTLNDIFSKEFLRRELVSVQSAMKFNDDQIKTYKLILEEAEAKLEIFKRNLFNNQSSDGLLNNEARQRINEAVLTTGLTERSKREQLKQLSSMLGSNDLGDTFPTSLKVQNYLAEISQKLSSEANLMKRFSSNSAEIIKINRSINLIRENIRREFENIYASSFPNLDAKILDLLVNKASILVDIQITEQKKQALTNALNSSKQLTAMNQSQEQKLKKLQEEVAINRKIYNLLLEQTQGTQIEEAMQRANAADRIQIIEPPSKPLEPASARKRLIAMVTLVMATGLGIGAVYLREYMDKSLQTVEEAEDYFDIPVLCVLPYLEREQIKDKNPKKDKQEYN